MCGELSGQLVLGSSSGQFGKLFVLLSARALLTTELLSDLRNVGVPCKRATMAATSSVLAEEWKIP